MKGEEFEEIFVALLAVLARGEGVSGIRPPAVLVEKMPCRLFNGVDTAAVAMVVIEWTN